MALKVYKPTTPGRRNMSVSSFAEVTKTKPEKSLVKGKNRISGRNSQGKITIRHRGGGAARKYRMVDFKRNDKLGIPANVTAVEYDPYRTAYIILVNYADGEKRYHLAPEAIKVGTKIISNNKAKVETGNRMELRYIPVGYSIYNVELTKGKGGQIVRSAGSSAKLVSLDGEKAQIQLPSGEVRYVEKGCFATIGTVSNSDHSNIKIGKAGRKRHLGRRPQVRGKAMNPVDHPHGGGEGNQPIGLKHPKTPWGMPALGVKTRNKNKHSNKWIIRRRKKKNR